MRHLIILVFIISNYFHSYTQNIIPNFSFESWENGEPTDWLTSNIPGDSIFNIYKVSPGYATQSAIGGLVIPDPLLNGITLAPLLESNTSNFGFDLTKEYDFLSLYYTFTPQSDEDFLSISISILDDQGSVYGFGAEMIRNTQPSFTSINIPIEYTEGNPAKAIISITVGNDGPTSTPNIGTAFVIDELELHDQATGVIEQTPNIFSELDIRSTFENTVTINFKTAYSVHYQIELININGQDFYQLFRGKSLTGLNTLTLSLPSIIPGPYICRIQSSHIQISKPIIVN